MLLRYITAEEEEGLCVVLLFRLLDRGGGRCWVARLLLLR